MKPHAWGTAVRRFPTFLCDMATTTLIFLGREGLGEIEQWVAGGRIAAMRDAVQLTMTLPQAARVVVAAPEPELEEQHPDLPVIWDFDAPSQSFHFGQRLAALMDGYPSDVFVYLGAGSLPLLPRDVLAQAVEEVACATTPLAITNNLHSSDWIVLNCPEAVRSRPHRLERDNALGWVLTNEASVEVRGLNPSAATRVDIDTPADLLALSLHPRTGPELSAYLRAHPQDTSRWRAAGKKLFTPASQIALIGRVASGVWAYVEAHTQVWIRVFSEERGMAASGRQNSGRVRSFVGAHLARVGAEAFFAELSQMVEAVFFDTRVVLAHHRLWPSAADRYASDLGLADRIQDSFLREFTAAAVNAPIPIVLGGHGVVSGGLYALVEIAEAGVLGKG
ncbi:MAG TPA: hypothetical protein VI793_14180 [Anaerolineales bacterium]|nr:hypothetical protein [Anaerolineales bacterium]